MLIKAITSFVEFDGQMHVFNPGDVGELPDHLANVRIADGHAVAASEPARRLPQLDRDGDGRPGGSKPASPPGLFGKNKAALLEIGLAEGAAVEDGMSAKDLMATIKEHRASSPALPAADESIADVDDDDDDDGGQAPG